MNRLKRSLSIFLIAGLGGATAISVDNYLEKDQTHTIQQTVSAPVRYTRFPAAGAESEINFVNAAEKTLHAVVHVKTTYEVEPQVNPFHGYDPFRDLFGSGDQKQQQQASGSGVIISNDGYIVTNNHVIAKADKIEVTLNDNRSYAADLIGSDPTTDLALLKVKEKNLPFIQYGNSDDIKVGEWVLAVGNPFNLNSTVTAGIVSAKGRNINILENNPDKGLNPIESYIQTDAAVNMGNSGGALVNTSGELIGINSAIASMTGSYAGYSFAVPVNIVKKVVTDLAEFGTVQRAFIGVSIRDIDSKLAQEKNISELKGVYVNGLTEGGAAKEAGVKDGDVITKVGDMEVNSVPQLQEQISRFRPGDKVMLTLRHDNKERIVPVTLKNKNGTIEVLKKENENGNFASLGATFETLKAQDLRNLSIENGLQITKLTSGKLRNAGIKEGFIITSIDKKRINSLEDLKNALDDKKGGVLIEGVYPNGLRAWYGLGI
jgi:serine protease Do